MHFQDSTYEPAHLFHCYFFRCCRFPPLAANSRENDVAAVVNGVEITQSEASFLLYSPTSRYKYIPAITKSTTSKYNIKSWFNYR